jgi:pimeloyl-ACP methyl ester carboxylesterase
VDSFVPVAGGVKLHVRHQPGDGARPFFLLHGLGSNARLWDEVADRLCAAGHPVYAVDMRGHGESDSPASGYDHATVVADLVGACAAIGLTDVLLAGHSWGGNIALRLSVEHPALVRALALIDSGIDPKLVGGTWEQYVSSVERLRPDTTGGTVESMRAFLRARHPSWSPTLIEASLADMRVNPDGSLSQRLSTEQFLSLVRSMWDDPPSRWYPAVTVPVMLLNAVPDATVGWQAIWGSYMERWVGAAVEAMPQAQSRWYRDADHNVHAEQPDRVADDLLDLARGVDPLVQV